MHVYGRELACICGWMCVCMWMSLQVRVYIGTDMFMNWSGFSIQWLGLLTAFTTMVTSFTIMRELSSLKYARRSSTSPKNISVSFFSSSFASFRRWHTLPTHYPLCLSLKKLTRADDFWLKGTIITSWGSISVRRVMCLYTPISENKKGHIPFKARASWPLLMSTCCKW